MAAQLSLTSEVLNAIKMPNIRPIPPYLAETDAVTSDIFMQSEYAQDYTIDTSNIHWEVRYTMVMFLTFTRFSVQPKIRSKHV